MSSYDRDDLLTLVIAERADGLSLQSGRAPVLYFGGEEHSIEGPVLTDENVELLVRSVTTTRQVRELRDSGKGEFVYRFRESTAFKVEVRVQYADFQLELQKLPW